MRFARMDGFTARGYESCEAVVSGLQSRAEAWLANDGERYLGLSGVKARIVEEASPAEGECTGVLVLEVAGSDGNVRSEAAHELLRSVIAGESADAVVHGGSFTTRPVEWDIED